MSTPVRRLLVDTSTLQDAVKDGIQAVVRAQDRELIDKNIRHSFDDSLDIDEAVQAQHPNDPRWDFLLGHGPSEKVVGLEAHSAKQSEVSLVIKKQIHARRQLAAHLRPNAKVVEWFWVASGKVDFVDFDREKQRLDKAGITFIGKRLLARHLPVAVEKKKR